MSKLERETYKIRDLTVQVFPTTKRLLIRNDVVKIYSGKDADTIIEQLRSGEHDSYDLYKKLKENAVIPGGP
jgi:Mg2+/Co2+ transporter CorB